jgi:hypothetical protein
VSRTPDHRDVDRLLEAALREHRADAAGAGAACLDAEALAAWADGALGRGEAQRVEMHLSSCAHCQSVAAAFARSAPAMPERAPWWQRLNARWLVPALAAAGAIALATWTIVPRSEPAPAAAPLAPPPMAAERQQAPAGAAGSPATASPRAQAAEPAPELRAAADAVQPLRRDTAAKAEAPANRVPPSDESMRSRVNTDPRAAIGGTAPVTALPAPPPPPAPSPVPAPAPPASKPAAATVGQAAAAPPPPPAAPAQRALSESLAFRKEATVVAEFSPPPARAQQAAGRGGGGGGRSAQMRAAPSTPAPPIRWRILSTGVVQRTTDGTNWSAVKVDAGVRAGVAPSPQVCWLVGELGLVLRATDGATFQRVSFPERVDLASVTATSDRQATVTTSGGRRFTTDDGGRTWRE